MATTEFPDPPSLKDPFKSFPSEAAKLQASESLSFKLHQDQVLRQQKASNRQLRLQRKLQEEERFLALREQETQHQADKLRLDRLAALHDQAVFRKEKIKSKVLKDQIALQSITNQRYAHNTLETEFFKRFLQPETERVRKVLAEKKLTQKSPSVAELQTHAMKYDEMRKEGKRRAEDELKQMRLDFRINEISQYPASQFSIKVLEEDAEMKRKQVQEAKRRKIRILKQKKYAILVKEMFAPETTPRIQLSPPIKQVIVSTPRHLLSKLESYSPKSVSKPELIIEKKDYLGELRKLREKMPLVPSYSVDWKEDLREELETEEKLRRVKEKSAKLDRKMRRTEACLNLMSPISPEALEATQHINDLLLSSVKAKLSLLNH